MNTKTDSIWAAAEHLLRRDAATDSREAAQKAAPQPAEHQQEAQSPVAYRHLMDDGWEYYDAPTGEDCPDCEPLYTTPQPAAQQGDAEQREVDARHAAIYRWMLGHPGGAWSILDNWFADEEAGTDELHDVLAARAAKEGN